MKIEKLKVTNKKLEINLKFYFWLKHLVKAKLSDNQTNNVIEILSNKSNYEQTIKQLEIFLENKILGIEKQRVFSQIIETIESNTDLEIFSFGIRLYAIKDLLLSEAKIKGTIDHETLAKLNPLSLEYDKKSLLKPYTTRVNGALLALLFFSRVEAKKTNLISKDAHNFFTHLSKQAISLKKNGLEPNQIFMLMFSESINQSIISDSGSNYEDRIKSVLIKIGIPEHTISKTHDKKDKSTEFDFFFTLEGREYGIGAKRTLRERYKQFIKTATTSNIDVFIEITLGLDLNEEKARIITSHGTILFVADEIYKSRKFLQQMSGVYSVSDLNLKTLKSL